MSIGSLVAVSELQAEGPARLLSQRSGFMTIKFLASGAEMTQEARFVQRYVLLPRTRIVARIGDAEQQAELLAKQPNRDPATTLLVYGVKLSDGRETNVREDAIIGVPTPRTPGEQLLTANFHDLKPVFGHAGTQLAPEPWGPQTFCARDDILGWRDSAWNATGGVVGLSGARVVPLPHQLVTARRVLTDRHIRFLLADEVGLGKTIEAGLIMQSLLAMQPNLRVLIIVPGALVSQWFLEMFVKFGGRSFLMLDSERLQTYQGNPWANEQFVLASNRAIEDLDAKGSLRFAQSKWDLLIVDECHRMHPAGILYKRVAVLSKSTHNVLLLSATPARQHPDAYLALLALLQPNIYRTADIESFQAKLKAHADVVELMTATQDCKPAQGSAVAKRWLKAFKHDAQLAERAQAFGASPAELFEAARDALMTHVREHYQLDSRIIRHRRHVLARLSESSGVGGLPLATRSRERVDYAPDAGELNVRAKLLAYQQLLVKAYGKDGVPPRLAHWLLQLELAASSHPGVLDRLLAMRSAVLDDPLEFDEYRKRASSTEDTAHVLRNDLSEREALAHVAISAACFCDPRIEFDAVKELRAAVTAWAKHVQNRPTARLKALIQRLTDFWEDHPQEKVLVFTSSSMAVQEIATALGRVFGEDRIETFGAHQDTIEREESVRRFRENDACSVLVSDPLGGEGRNFQFVSAVAHHDLPWSVAAVEQRIGRVDRIGRDGDVPSWVMAPKGDHADAHWFELLDQAVGVFAASSSGLEFVSDAVEVLSLDALLTGGAAKVKAIIPEAVAIVAKERSAQEQREDELFREEAQVYADAARMAAAVAKWQTPIEAILRWVRGMGGSAKREEERPRATALRTRNLDTPERGVFDRDTALAHPDLSFFSLGNGTIDRLSDDALNARWCRAMAWRRKPSDAVKTWEGLRVCYELNYDLSAIIAAKLPIEILRRLFTVAAPQRHIAFVRCSDGGRESDQVVIDHLASCFDARKGDAPLSQLQSRDIWAKPLISGTLDKIVSWQSSVERALAAAEKQAQPMLDNERASVLAKLEEKLNASTAIASGIAASAAARFGETNAETKRLNAEADDEKRQAGALRAAVSGAQMAIANVAYIAVV